MIVCICSNVTESDILEAIDQGYDTTDKLIKHLGLCRQCGSCKQFFFEVYCDYTDYEDIDQ